MRRLFIGLASFVSFAAIGCEAPTPTRDHAGRISSALSGGGVTNVGTSTALPEAAVVQLSIQLSAPNSFGACTGTVIENVGRLGGAVILTAAHCFCATTSGLGTAGSTTQ